MSSSACASVVAGVRLGLLARAVRVDLPGGTLRLTWDASPGRTYRVTAIPSLSRSLEKQTIATVVANSIEATFVIEPTAFRGFFAVETLPVSDNR